MAGQTRTEIQAVSPHLEQHRKREGKKKKQRISSPICFFSNRYKIYSSPKQVEKNVQEQHVSVVIKMLYLTHHNAIARNLEAKESRINLPSFLPFLFPTSSSQ